MKKKVLSSLLIAGLAASAFAGCGSADAGNTTTQTAENRDGSSPEVTKILCGTTTGFYPYAYNDENDNFVGYDIELIEAVFDRLPQYELEFQLNDWDAVLTGLDSGLYQISTECIFYSEERAEKYLFSDTVSYDPVVVITDAEHEDVSKLEELAGLKLPVTSGSIWSIAVEKYNEANPDKQIILEYAETDYFTRFTQAEAGEAIIFADYGSAIGMIEEHGFNVRAQLIDQDDLGQYIDPSYEYFLISRGAKDAEKFQADVNAALAEVIADGTASEISIKYFGEDLTTAAYPYSE